ncbi:PEP-CTERM sorting domain-containing protein [Methylophilus sp. TWE2]|uniref:PEP-CTERM sorting domain-containing protein n=1 Tax=Methylophilus sp. TWE2 TaxID=1662285 RepID=UPI000670A080|nr:PEP-CTERM sorting domain-containing protein [Methylophilus sp. TWE2]AKR42063.1 hypothetical protein ACJ67_00420 [Methylophilus sp. TWE2]
MLRLTALISWMTFMPLAAQANTTMISLASSTCSGAMSISSLSGASLSCAGNLSLNGGWIDSDASIFIHAAGDLLLENLNLNAPEISISTIQGGIQVASTVNIQSIQNQANRGEPLLIGWQPVKRDIIWSSFNLGVSPGSNIQISSPSTNSNAMNPPTGGGSIYVMNTNGIVFSNASISIGNLTTTGSITLNNSISVSSVPEANTSAMLLLGLGFLAFRRKTY